MYWMLWNNSVGKRKSVREKMILIGGSQVQGRGGVVKYKINTKLPSLWGLLCFPTVLSGSLNICWILPSGGEEVQSPTFSQNAGIAGSYRGFSARPLQQSKYCDTTSYTNFFLVSQCI